MSLFHVFQNYEEFFSMRLSQKKEQYKIQLKTDIHSSDQNLYISVIALPLFWQTFFPNIISSHNFSRHFI